MSSLHPQNPSILLSDAGEVEHTAFPGGYSILYLCSDGETLCSRCVQESLAEATEGELPQVCDPHSGGWHVTAHFVHWEGPPEQCAHCGQELPSEYGDPDAEEPQD